MAASVSRPRLDRATPRPAGDVLASRCARGPLLLVRRCPRARAAAEAAPCSDLTRAPGGDEDLRGRENA